MPHLLHLDSSARDEGSVTRRLSAEYVAAWKTRHPQGTVTYRDLAEDTPGFVTPEWITAAFGPAEAQNDRTAAARKASEALIRELEEADAVVLGVPVYNFGVPAVFKAWIDRVMLAGRTFAFDENGPRGLLTGKKVIVVRASGSDFDDPFWAPLDHHAPYIRGVLGFMGITDVDIVGVSGHDPALVEAAVSGAVDAFADAFGEEPVAA